MTVREKVKELGKEPKTHNMYLRFEQSSGGEKVFGFDMLELPVRCVSVEGSYITIFY